MTELIQQVITSESEHIDFLLVGRRLTFYALEMGNHDKVFVLVNNGNGYLVKLWKNAINMPKNIYLLVTTGINIPIVVQEHPYCSVLVSVLNKCDMITIKAAENIVMELGQRLE